MLKGTNVWSQICSDEPKAKNRFLGKYLICPNLGSIYFLFPQIGEFFGQICPNLDFAERSRRRLARGVGTKSLPGSKFFGKARGAFHIRDLRPACFSEILLSAFAKPQFHVTANASGGGASLKNLPRGVLRRFRKAYKTPHLDLFKMFRAWN